MAKMAQVIDGDTGELVDEPGFETFTEEGLESVTRDDYILIRTMTMKAIQATGGVVASVGERVRVARIWGRVDSWDTVSSTPGEEGGTPLEVVKGTFRGVNCITNQMYQAPVLALPSAFQPTLVTEMQTNGKPFEFVIEIIATPASNKSGYSYLGRMKMDTSAPDPLAALETRWAVHALNSRKAPPLIRLRSDGELKAITNE